MNCPDGKTQTKKTEGKKDRCFVCLMWHCFNKKHSVSLFFLVHSAIPDTQLQVLQEVYHPKDTEIVSYVGNTQAIHGWQ